MPYTADGRHMPLSEKDKARREIAHAHKLASQSASLASMSLGMWCGNGDYATFPQVWRDRQGRRALSELDAAIAELTAVRAQLAEACGPDTDDSPEGK